MNTTLEPGFCPSCYSILPFPDGPLSHCFSCKQVFDHELFIEMKSYYRVDFNTSAKAKNVDGADEEGPVVEKRCPKCNNDRMSYATIQLRSADEGQTVFYTCTKCKYKETENS